MTAARNAVSLWDADLPFCKNFQGGRAAIVDYSLGGERQATLSHLLDLIDVYTVVFSTLKFRGLNTVAIFSSNRFELPALLLSLMKCDITVCLRSAKYDEDFNRDELGALCPDLVILDQENLPSVAVNSFNGIYRCIGLSDISGSNLSGLEFNNDRSKHLERDDRLILYTSGSNGKPKGVVFKKKALSNWTTQKSLSPESVGRPVLIPASLEHISSLSMTLGGLQMGRTIVYPKKFVPSDYLDLIEHWKIMHFSGTPTMFRMIMSYLTAANKAPPQSLKSILVFGEPLSPDFVKALSSTLRCRALMPTYGLTEAGGAVFNAMQTDIKDLNGNRCGKTTKPGVEIKLKPLSEGNIAGGQLWVRSKRAASRYFNDPEASKQRFAGGWIKTGDLFEEDGDGFFTHIGREDDMVIVESKKVFTGYVRSLIKAHNGVEDCRVFSITGGDGRSQLAAAVLLKPTRTDSEEGINALRRETLQIFTDQNARASFPEIIFCMPAWPMLASGKVDKLAIRKYAQDFTAGKPRRNVPVKPRGANNTVLALKEFFERTFNQSVGPDDNYHDLGGDSLTSVILSLEISEKLGREVTSYDIYNHLTLTDLAKHIDKG